MPVAESYTGLACMSGVVSQDCAYSYSYTVRVYKKKMNEMGESGSYQHKRRRRLRQIC